MPKILAIFLFFIAATIPCLAKDIILSEEDIQWVGENVFKNECAQREECLLQWNEGEEFISLGIGHFIWYPKDMRGPFEESFPEFVRYAKTKGAEIPGWLNADPVPACPWRTREEFLANRSGPQAQELRQLLTTTKMLQTYFIVERLDNALPLMVNSVAAAKRQKIERQFNRMITSRNGIYAMIDYINFKGLGIVDTERYEGQGWGLLQVLSGMQGHEPGLEAVREFSGSAKIVLTERIKNSPPQRGEDRWTNGWLQRVSSYAAF